MSRHQRRHVHVYGNLGRVQSHVPDGPGRHRLHDADDVVPSKVCRPVGKMAKHCRIPRISPWLAPTRNSGRPGSVGRRSVSLVKVPAMCRSRQSEPIGEALPAGA